MCVRGGEEWGLTRLISAHKSHVRHLSRCPSSHPAAEILWIYFLPRVFNSEALPWTTPWRLPVIPAAPSLAEGSRAEIWGDVSIPERETRGRRPTSQLADSRGPAADVPERAAKGHKKRCFWSLKQSGRQLGT